jgi:hypothetical protein
MFDTPPPAQIIQASQEVQERYIKEQERLRKRAEEERKRQIDAENRRKLAANSTAQVTRPYRQVRVLWNPSRAPSPFATTKLK